MAILNNLIVNGNSRILNTLYAKDMTISNSFTMGGRLVLSKASDVALTSASDPALVIGPMTGTHLEFDQNGIMAKTNNTTGAGQLNFNIEGGVVAIGKSGITNVDTNGKLTTSNFKSTGTIESATIRNSGQITSYDGNFTNVLRATTWDLQSIQATKGGALYIAPTYVQGSTFVNVVTTSTTMVIQDTGISSKSFSGIDWNAGARVKISGTIGGVTTGTVEGILAANMNNTANKLELKSLSGGNWSSVAANTYTAGTSGCHDLTVMLYNTGTYPVGILLNCYGTNNKATIDIYGGTSATPHVAIGLLNGRFSQLDGVDVSGWGIYTDNGYFTGTIHAGSGRIGGFEIASSAIKTAGVAVTSNADNSVSLSSSDFTRTVAGASRAGLRFAIGDKFGVTGDGVLYCSNAHVSGEITATSGKIGGCSITDGVLQVASANITALDAAKITSGTIAAARIGANSITADKLTVDAMTVGSKNLLVGTTTAKSQAVNVPSSYVLMDCYYTPKSMEIINLGAKKDDLLQITFDWKVTSATTYGNFRIECYGTTSSNANAYIAALGTVPIVTTSASNLSGTVHASVKLTDALLKTKNIRIRVDNSVFTLAISNMVLWYGSGGFQMDSDSIHTANVAISSNADNSIGLSSIDFTRTVAGASRSGLRFAIGDKFGVTGDGAIYASSATITGAITATSGYIGGTSGFYITTNKMYSNNHSAYNTAVAGVYIGTDYISLGSGGVTYFKNDGTGKIGKWIITTTSIYKGNATMGTAGTGNMYFGDSGLSISNTFKVSNAGALTATGVNITGTIDATSIKAKEGYYIYNDAYSNFQFIKVLKTDWNNNKSVNFTANVDAKAYILGSVSTQINAGFFSSYAGTNKVYYRMVSNGFGVDVEGDIDFTAYNKDSNSLGSFYFNQTRVTTASDIHFYNADSYGYPDAKNCASGSNVNFGSITVPAGVHLIEFTVNFASNSSGRREVWISGSSTGSNYNRYAKETRHAVNGAVTFVHGFFISPFTEQKTWYLVGYQNSGSTLSCTYGLRAISLLQGTDYSIN